MKGKSWEKSCPKCGAITPHWGPPAFIVTYIKHSPIDEERLRLTCRCCGYSYVIPCLDAKEVKP